jgi:hypothetical protein
MSDEFDAGSPGMSLREAKWLRCDWPHAIMSREYEQSLTRFIDGWRPWIARRAKGFARENEQLRDELEQAAMIRLWCRGLKQLAEDDAGMIRRILRFAMIDALRTEVREIMRNGERLLSYA